MDSCQELQYGISICSGYGGIELGLSLAGLRHRTVCFLEIEAFAIANLVAKMETGLLVPAPVWTNLKTFNAEAFRGVDFITAGYPCQPFSCAGQRKGKDDPRHLWPHLRRIYQTIQPRWMLFENVEGHVTLGLSTVISDLEEDCYRTAWGLFTAAEVGAPHRRKRVFILAHANSQRERAGRGQVYQLDDSRRVGQAFGRLQASGVKQSSEVMGDSEHDGLHGAAFAGSVTETVQHDTQGTDTACELTGTDTAGELADTNKPGSQGRDSGIMSERAVQWPARPGSPQYDWEEPRVTEPGLGRAVDGISSRVDRLRLLGNGVVPQQAARAYTILKERLTRQSEVTNG